MKLLFGAAAVAAASVSSAVVSVYSQPWNPVTKLPAWVSAVTNCDQPSPRGRTCFDDFVISSPQGEPVPIARIDWWGNLPVAQQIGKPYLIGICRSNPNNPCQPDLSTMVKTCVVPRTVFAGPDCKNRSVFRFMAVFPNPLSLPTNTRLWITIAEDDSQSARPLINDFWWSAFQPVRGCRAVAYNGTIWSYLTDPCNAQPDDLSFILFRP